MHEHKMEDNRVNNAKDKNNTHTQRKAYRLPDPALPGSPEGPRLTVERPLSCSEPEQGRRAARMHCPIHVFGFLEPTQGKGAQQRRGELRLTWPGHGGPAARMPPLQLYSSRHPNAMAAVLRWSTKASRVKMKV